MDKQDYIYQLKPLFVPGSVYLIVFPILVSFFWFVLKISYTQFLILAGIYLSTAIGIIALWVYGRSKRFRVEPDKLVLTSLSGEELLTPKEIKRIALHKTRKGEECVQIRTRSKDYYLNEQYFPFPELMTDLESFIKEHKIRTNFTAI